MKASFCIVCMFVPAFGGMIFAENPNAIFRNAAIAGDKALAAKGDVTANIRLGYRYLTGSAGAVDPAQAYKYFAAVASKSPAASAWLGYVGVSAPSVAIAGVNHLGVVKSASDAGDPVAMTLLGRMYHHGNGVGANINAAKQLYNQVGSTFALAQTFLGEAYLESHNPHDQAEAASYLLSAAAAGDTISMIDLAGMYARGVGVKQDYSEAVHWLSVPFAHGDPTAIYQRGRFYQRGLGLPKSVELAASLFQRAATAGYAPAQTALGMCYASGSGVPKDLVKAAYWLGLAAPKYPYAAQQLAKLSGQSR